MGKIKTYVGNSASKSRVWGYSPPVTATAPSWTLTLNGKSLTYISTGTPSDAVQGMLNLWQSSQEPEFQEISASVPTTSSPADSPQGSGTNEIQAVYITGEPTGGSFQVAWKGSSTPFLADPTAGLIATDSGNAGNPNGAYKYTVTFLCFNALGQIGETKPSPETSITVASHSVSLTSIPTGPIGTIARRIYRTAAGGASGTEKLLWTIWDNSATTFTDNIADGSLGAAQPTSNLTGIPYNATATQLQAVLQSLESVAPGNAVVTGSGTTDSPWLLQFTNSLGAKDQALIGAGAQSFVYPITVPAGITPQVIVSEIQRGILANAPAPSDGNTLLLVGNKGVPFYLTSQVTGTIPPKLAFNLINSPFFPPTDKIAITELTPAISVTRTQQARAGANELQQVTIQPNAEAGSTFTLSWGGHTTNAIPVPPVAPTVATGGAGSLTGAYYYVQTFLTATGETEPSAPSAIVSPSAQQISVTLTNGPGVVTKKRLYRTKAGGAITGPYFLVTTINDNTTTAFADNVTDATIGANPQPPTTNGVLQGELEGLAGVGPGNVQVSGANFTAFSGMVQEQAFPAIPPVISTALSTTAAPKITSAVGALGGGSLSTGEYFYQVTAVDTQGETLPGNEFSAFVNGSTGRVSLGWSSATGANGYRVYRGSTSSGENVLLGTVAAPATSFIDYGASPSPVVYTVEFVGSLGNASQAILTGSAAGVSTLPTISLTETQAGYPIENEVQVLGWTQKYGNVPPAGTFKIVLPSFAATTEPIKFDAAPNDVLSAIQAAVPIANHNDFAVSAVQSNTTTAQTFAVTYQGSLALLEIPVAVVDVSGMKPATGDTVLPYSARAALGSRTGRNEIITATINNNPTGGTFGLNGTLANGNVISATGVAFSASASTLQAAFPSGTVSISGSAGGPYTIEAVGEAGAQKVVWSATSSPSGSGGATGSPPASNTTGLPAPGGLQVQGSSQGAVGMGALSVGTTYYWVVTATNGSGETTRSAEVSFTATTTDTAVSLTWSAVAGATGYKVYRGVSSSNENLLVGTLGGQTSTQFIDSGPAVSSATPSGSSEPALNLSASSRGAGELSAGTYYYQIKQTGLSSEVNAVLTGGPTSSAVLLSWVVDGTVNPIQIYRGTSSGGENVLIATVPYTNSQSFFFDAGGTSTSTTPPASNTTGIAAPVQSVPSTSASGGNLASNTYYYEVTATNAVGETTASNEKSIAVTGPTGEVTVNWATVTGATGYKIYRGTAASGENILAGVVTGGSTTSFTDTGAVSGLLSVTELAAGLTSLNDTQALTITNAGGGTFSLTLQGASTGELPWNITGSVLQAAIGALPGVGTQNVTVSSSITNGQSAFTVTFVGALAGKSQGLLLASGIGVSFPPAVNNSFVSPPAGLFAALEFGGNLAQGTYYYVVTAVSGGIETTVSNEAFATTLGPSSAQRSIGLTWTGVDGAAAYRVYRGIAPGAENELIGTVGIDGSGFKDDGTTNPQSTLLGGGAYSVAVTGTDFFTLSFNGQTTATPLVWNASASTIQSELDALSSIGANNATVTGSGPWTVSLAQAIVPTGTLSGQLTSQTTVSAATTLIYSLTIKDATGGTFSVTAGGESAILPYNATASQLQAALSGLSAIGSGNVTVAGSGPWVITITPAAQSASLILTVDGSALTGKTGSLAVYPRIFCEAIGLSFYDAPANWADGSPPSVYLPPPTMNSVVPIPTDATLAEATHGSLTSGQAYYYKVTATNANGETNPSGEGSAVAFAGANIYLNGPTAGTYTLSYGGQTTGTIAFNASAATIAGDLNGLSSINANGGSCTVTGLGTQASPFAFSLAGTLAGTAPTTLTANSSGLTGGTVSVENLDTRSLAVSWNEVYGATGYKVYRGASAGGENVLVATLTSPDQTTFIDDGTYTTTVASPPAGANNYNTAVGDDVHFTNSAVSCLYNIAASAVNGYSIHGGFAGSNYSQINSLTIDASYTGRIGLSRINGGSAGAGYTEYRPTNLQIMGPPGAAFSITIGNGSGSGSGLIALDTGSCQVSGTCNFTGQTTQDPAALLWIGSNSSGEWNLFYGSMAIGAYPDQVFSLGTVRQAYTQNVSSDTSLEIGAGGTLTTLLKNGGSTLVHCPVTTITCKAGTVTQDAGTVATLTIDGGTYVSRSTGTITTLSVSGSGKFDRTQDSRPVSITNTVTLYSGASYLDPHGATDSSGLSIQLVGCGIEDVRLELGRNITLVRTQN